MPPQERLSSSQYRDAMKRATKRRAKTEDDRQRVRAITFSLSTAPGVNNLYANVAGVGRVKTAAYRKWLKTAKLELMAQRCKPVVTPVTIRIQVPETSRLDIDAPIKATLDLLVSAGIIPGDSKQYVRAGSFSFWNGETMLVEVTGVAA